MAVMIPTRLSFKVKLKAMIYFFFSKKKFERMQEDDNSKRESLPEKDISTIEMQIIIVRRALFQSLILVLISLLFAFFIYFVIPEHYVLKETLIPLILQLSGALLLLWATLFVRGWEIQTYSGVTLIERVNRWIFKSMYFIGTISLLLGIFLII